MTRDIASNLYASLGLPIRERVAELTGLIDQPSPFRDLQSLFQQLVGSVFGGGSAAAAGWGLRVITREKNPYEFDALHRFLSPQGPVFRLCYKLLADIHLKYHFPLNVLPLDVQLMLERGRYPQFYADLLNVDSQTLQLVSLALNPFDYYMFHFATHLLNSDVNKFAWEGSSVYIELVCDYLIHFLPADPTVPVTPHIPYYTGKATLGAPLQTSTRQLHSPSLLLIQELPGLDTQHSPPSTQSQPNQIWRTETAMQVFIDVWLSVDDCSPGLMDTHSYWPQKSSLPSTSAERVKVARMLVKQIHVFSCKHSSAPTPRSAALRRGARQLASLRVYKLVSHLVAVWPLDTSFRLVLELWLSAIQPWRYTDTEVYGRSSDQYGMQRRNEDKVVKTVDASYTQFIAENLPMYTTIFQQMIPRFMRLDLTVPKNAVMIFRMAKVFVKPNLTRILREIETAAMGQNIGMNHSTVYWNVSYNYNSMHDVPITNKWGAIAKQAIAELNSSCNTCYQPMWGERTRDLVLELMKKLANAKIIATKTVEDIETKRQQNKGFWSTLNFWSTIDDDDFLLADRKAVPSYLDVAIQYLSVIFGLDSSIILAVEAPRVECHADSSSFTSSSSQLSRLTRQMRNNSTNIKCMGDPDLAPIGSDEFTVLVRMLYQLSTRLNEMYRRELNDAWRREDLWGCVCRELVQPPQTVRAYTEGGRLVAQELGPRLSLRRFASQAFLVWLSVGYLLSYSCGYGGLVYLLVLVFVFSVTVFCKAALKKIGLIKDNNLK